MHTYLNESDFKEPGANQPEAPGSTIGTLISVNMKCTSKR